VLFGAAPLGGLVFDLSGELYGTTLMTGTAANSGTLYRFHPGTRHLQTLHRFSGASDGGTPNDFLVFDNGGTLYGTTSVGGSSGFGTIFEYVP
jgi:uncharacterized repeat protein (TIGR03803 family)